MDVVGPETARFNANNESIAADDRFPPAVAGLGLANQVRRSGRLADEAGETAALFTKLAATIAAEKAPSGPIAWVVDGRNLRFTVALEIDGITQEGIALFGRASVEMPDQHVTLGLSWYDVGGHQRTFDRIDWRPVGQHTNKGVGPPELHFVAMDGTHHHALADNAALPIGLMRALGENLPVARPVEPEPDWPAFVALAGQRWNIERLAQCPLPPWQYPLALSVGPDRV